MGKIGSKITGRIEDLAKPDFWYGEIPLFESGRLLQVLQAATDAEFHVLGAEGFSIKDGRRTPILDAILEISSEVSFRDESVVAAIVDFLAPYIDRDDILFEIISK